MYIAKPGSGSGPGVVVLHSWWGFTAFFRDLCDRLADEGFVSLGTDLFDGATATTIPEARRLRARATAARREPAYKYLTHAIGTLTADEAVTGSGIGVIGFSMGGHWAYWLAQRPDLPILATTSFYAVRDGDYSDSSSSFLAHFAETDDWVSAAGIRKLERSLRADGRPAAFYTYPGTGHWFCESDRSEAYRPAAAAIAWDRTLAFLRERLA